MQDPKRYTITAALPYTNGPVHIGHLAGVYVPADIYARYLRLNDKEVAFVCGSDEHGVPITLKAKAEGVSPQAVVDKYHEIIKSSFKEFGITFDNYSRTSAPIHHETASDFFKDLYEHGKFIEETSAQLYDEDAKQFLADRFIVGTCPKCGFEESYGDQCENCGTSHNAQDLINPKSVITGNVPSLKETKHWYLPLNEYQNWLSEWILKGHKKDWKANVLGQVKSWVDDGLKPRAVTRDLDWGIPVPVKGAEGKVLYVWFDAPIGYISSTKEWAKRTGKDWEPFWKDQDTSLIHFIGKDNIVFHCIIFPAMLKAQGSYILPENVPANEFLNLEGNKISTSKNWAVWLHEYLVDFPEKQDVLRYVLTANAPETKDNDIDLQTLELMSKYPDIISSSIKRYRFREALSELMNLARLGNKYLADEEPWKQIKTDPERVKTIMFVALQIASALAVLSEPFLPFTSGKLKGMLNMDDLKTVKWSDVSTEKMLLPSQHQIEKAELLFSKIEDAEIQLQIDKLEATKASNIEVKIEPQKETINFEDFTKLDIRIGTILEAEKIPKTKKLLKLKVDVGIDIRTIVSGIAESFDPKDIIGQKVSVLVNLAPRKLRGVESQGMILMSDTADGKLSFIEPDGDTVGNGERVS